MGNRGEGSREEGIGRPAVAMGITVAAASRSLLHRLFYHLFRAVLRNELNVSITMEGDYN